MLMSKSSRVFTSLYGIFFQEAFIPMDNDIHFWYLRQNDLLTRLNESEIKQLYDISTFRRAVKDEIIYSHDKDIINVYLLNQGRIKIAFRIGSNIEVVAEILKEGDIFGELTLKKSANIHFEFAQVLSTDAIICSFGLLEFKNILGKTPNLATEYSLVLAEKLKIISGKFSDLAFKDVRARVLNFFILHAQYEGKWTGNKAEINMLCTQKDIASFTASSRQTVSAIINDLIKERKIIYEGRSKVIIPDIHKLDI